MSYLSFITMNITQFYHLLQFSNKGILVTCGGSHQSRERPSPAQRTRPLAMCNRSWTQSSCQCTSPPRRRRSEGIGARWLFCCRPHWCCEGSWQSDSVLQTHSHYFVRQEFFVVYLQLLYADIERFFQGWKFIFTLSTSLFTEEQASTAEALL